MCPVVAKVEDVHKLLAEVEVGESLTSFIEDLLVEVGVRSADLRAIRQFELVEVRDIPPSKGAVNCTCQLREGMTRCRSNEPSGPRPAVFAPALNQVDAN